MRKKIIAVILAVLSLAGVAGVASAPPAAATSELAYYEDFNIASTYHNYQIRFAYWVNDDTNYFTVVAQRYDKNWNFQGTEVSNYFKDSVCPTLEWSSTYGYHIAYRDNETWQRTWTCQYSSRTNNIVGPMTNHVDITGSFYHAYYCWGDCRYEYSHGNLAYGPWAPVYRGAGDHQQPIQRLL